MTGTTMTTEHSVSEPDWDALKRLYTELGRLQQAGAFDKPAFLRLYDEMLEAADGDEEFLGGLLAVAEDSWLQ